MDRFDYVMPYIMETFSVKFILCSRFKAFSFELILMDPNT